MGSREGKVESRRGTKDGNGEEVVEVEGRKRKNGQVVN